MTTFIKNQNGLSNNYIKRIDKDNYISYNPKPPFALGNYTWETALVFLVNKKTDFYIVELDLREELENITTLKEAVDIFSKYEPWFWSWIRTKELLKCIL